MTCRTRTPSLAPRCTQPYDLLQEMAVDDGMGGRTVSYPVKAVLMGFAVPLEPDNETIMMAADDMDEWSYVYVRQGVERPYAPDRLRDAAGTVWDIKSIKNEGDTWRCIARQMKGNR